MVQASKHDIQQYMMPFSSHCPLEHRWGLCHEKWQRNIFIFNSPQTVAQQEKKRIKKATA